MNEYFEREITALERELTNLKTTAQRSAGIIETISKTVDVNVPLGLEYNAGGVAFARGKAIYQVTPESDSIVVFTLDWYNGDVYKVWDPWLITRTISTNTVKLDDGRICIIISVEGTMTTDDGTMSDVEKLKQGQSVVVNVKLTARSTDNFTMGVYS